MAKSSLIERAIYDGAKQTLAVTFTTGKTYLYFDISADLYSAFVSAPSQGHSSTGASAISSIFERSINTCHAMAGMPCEKLRSFAEEFLVPDSIITRRSALATTISAALIASASQALAQTGGSEMDAALEHNRHDWDWLAGNWRVRHHRLTGRLIGATEWQDFDGTCAMVPTLNGFGNMDDNWLDLPAGAYRAMGIRAFNPETRLWSIWWLDERVNTIDPPVRGGFANGVGEFTGDDTLRGQPIKVRFRWTDIQTAMPRWEQAFSPDGGASWEVNWRMEFIRA